MGGSGGGNFRYMLSRFLAEGAGLAAEPDPQDAARTFQQIGDGWAEVGERFRLASEADDPASSLPEIGALLSDLADQEENGWHRLREIAGA